MNSFISFSKKTQTLLCSIIACNQLHAKWLNTLSYLENCGARKIAACEHPTLVKEEMLKHASEEFRHAHYLKKQMGKITKTPLITYNLSTLLGGTATLHYLTQLDIQACRYLKTVGLTENKIKEAAYLMVTYAIELRASELYPLYEEILRKTCSPILVKSILLEEKEHLSEMQEGLTHLSNGLEHAANICHFESILCHKWLQAIEKSF